MSFGKERRVRVEGQVEKRRKRMMMTGKRIRRRRGRGRRAGWYRSSHWSLPKRTRSYFPVSIYEVLEGDEGQTTAVHRKQCGI